MRPFFRFHLAAALLIAMTSTLAQAQEPDTARRDRVLAAAAPYIDRETVFLGYIDLDTAWGDGAQRGLVTLLGPEGNQFAAHPGFGMAKQAVKQFQEAGAEEVVFTLSLLDIHAEGGPVAIVTTSDPAQSHKVEQMVKSFIAFDTRNEGVRAESLRDARGSIVVASPGTLERMKGLTPVARPTLTEPLANLLDDPNANGAGLVTSMGSDARRVVRELFPRLPAPFDKVTGTLLADDIKYDTIAVGKPPEWSIRWEIETRHADAATTLKEAAEAGLKLLAKFDPQGKSSKPYTGPVDVPTESLNSPPGPNPQVAEIVRRISAALEIKKEGARLVVEVDHGSQLTQDLVKHVLGPAVQDARNAARRSQQMNNFKQVALALLNFHDTQKHFPAASAIVDKDGKPLLSWRVAILPYLGEQQLFEKFRVDESWDSEHNLKLAKEMPAVFADPRHPELAAEGKTTVMLPVHTEGVFRPLGQVGAPLERQILGKKFFLAQGRLFKEITDGTSNTMMAVEVAPERAVVWTRPDDWQVDLENPLEGLASPGRKTVVFAMFDGSAHALDVPSTDVKYLRALITRAGGEVPER